MTAGLFRGEITGRHVLFALLGFFGVMIAVNAVFLYYAIETFNGVETVDAYRKGLAYDARVAEDRLQARLGWRGAVQYDSRARRLSLRLVDKGGRSVADLAVTAKVGRPATDRFDRSLRLVQTEPGLYGAALALPDLGNWIVAVEARRLEAGKPVTVYRQKERLWVKPNI